MGNRLKNFLRKKTNIWIISIITIVSVGIYSFTDKDFALVKYLDIYFTLFREVNTYYVDETDPEKLVKNSIEGMLESLDPYTVFIPENELENYDFMTTGEYGGIGAYIRKIGKNIVLAEILEGYPADKAGLKTGDILLEIDGKSVVDKNNQDIGELLKGSPNSEVELTIKCVSNNKTLKKKLQRSVITINNVPYFGLVSDNVGYIKLSNFTTNANKEVKNALSDLKSRGAKGIIIDLRNNPGGLLIEAIDIANIFVSKGQEIVKTKGRMKQWETTFTTSNEAIDTQIPLVILINKNSASASEIVAGSFQDLDRAVIIGQKSFGKGLVQATRKLSYNTKLKITTAKYYIPSGRCIQSKDYTHRDTEGKATEIPDSMIHVFETKNGRKVKDGGGIMPDVLVEEQSISRIALNLYSRNYIFNFVTNFTLNHDSISKPSRFSLTDDEYQNFITYTQNLGFDYINETDDAMAKLKAAALKENIMDSSLAEFSVLEKKLKKNKFVEFQHNKSEIVDLLNEEIAGRYYYQKGKIEVSLKNDPSIKKAIEVIQNPKKYTFILGTNKNVVSKK